MITPLQKKIIFTVFKSATKIEHYNNDDISQLFYTVKKMCSYLYCSDFVFTNFYLHHTSFTFVYKLPFLLKFLDSLEFHSGLNSHSASKAPPNSYTVCKTYNFCPRNSGMSRLNPVPNFQCH